MELGFNNTYKHLFLILNMPKEKESDLVRLKKDYAKLQKKYSLPSFENMNQDFSIEKAAELETDYLIREIRKFDSSEELSKQIKSDIEVARKILL